MRPILVVDDEFDIAEVVGSILRADGYPVELASNGREALQHLAAKGAPSLVILDVMMPFVNGLEVLRHMKRTAGLEQVPVILMSAVSPTVAQKDFGWNAFLRKPFNLDALTALVVQYAGKPELPQAASGS